MIAVISDCAKRAGSVNVSERTIYRELAALKQMGLIRRVGSDKTGHWEVIEANLE